MMHTNQQTISERRRGRVIASPRARRAMRERGLDPHSLRGSGPGGRIVETDVLAAAETFGRTAAGSGDPRRAHFWLQATADVTSLLEVQSQIAEEVERLCGVPLRLADFLLRAMALALTDSPRANRFWQGERCVEGKAADVGLEIETADGRLVQVIPQADRLRLLELVSRRAGLSEAGAPVATSLCDLTDYPIDSCAAVLLPPRTSVLAVGRPAPRPTAVESRSGLRQSLCLSLTADQRAMPPETAAAFLGRIVELLEHPFLLLCERLLV